MTLPLNKIICGDCLEVMKDWPDNCVDLVVTDPPYNLGKNYGPTCNDKMPEKKYWKWFKDVFKQLYRISRDGYLYFSHSDRGTYKAQPIIIRLGYKYKQTLIWWGKNGYSMSLHRKTWSYRHEAILFFEKGEAPPLEAGDPGMWYTSVIEVPRPQSNFKEGRCHPTQKPIKLYSTLIQRTPGQLVFDPFCGSGTCCVAAKLLGRNYIGIDISEGYCKIARMRIKAVDTGVPVKEQLKGQMGLFESSEA